MADCRLDDGKDKVNRCVM